MAGRVPPQAARALPEAGDTTALPQPQPPARLGQRDERRQREERLRETGVKDADPVGYKDHAQPTEHPLQDQPRPGLRTRGCAPTGGARPGQPPGQDDRQKTDRRSGSRCVCSSSTPPTQRDTGNANML